MALLPLAGLVLALLLDRTLPRRRQALGLLLAAAVFALVLLPHALWLHRTDFLPFRYARAMTEGALLYVEEFNRVPEETMNVLLGVLSEREMHVPRYGRVAARPTFRLVAAMNPCPCGYLGATQRACRCTPDQIARYQHRRCAGRAAVDLWQSGGFADLPARHCCGLDRALAERGDQPRGDADQSGRREHDEAYEQ